MKDISKIFKQNKKEFSSIDEKIEYYGQKILLPTYSKAILQDIEILSRRHYLNFTTLTKCLDITTMSMLNIPSFPYQKTGFCSYSADLTAELLCSLVYADALKRDSVIICTSDYSQRKPENLGFYLSKLEKYVQDIDVLYKEDRKTHKLFQFADAIRETVNRVPIWVDINFVSNSLKIVRGVGGQGASVLLTPNSPSHAVTSLHDDKPRLLYAEFAKEESAEFIVTKYYGTDGLYSEHYKNLLKVPSRF